PNSPAGPLAVIRSLPVGPARRALSADNGQFLSLYPHSFPLLPERRNPRRRKGLRAGTRRNLRKARQGGGLQKGEKMSKRVAACRFYRHPNQEFQPPPPAQEARQSPVSGRGEWE